MVIMNRLSTEKRAQIIGCLVEGNSIRATVRITGTAKNTITKLLIDLGVECAAYQDRVLRDLPCKTIECDEMWGFCYAKQKNVPDEHQGTFGYGDVWTWTAIDADSKLIVSWHVGDRSQYTGTSFMSDLKARLANKVQLTTDGHKVYAQAVEGAFGADVDYAMLIKIYGNDSFDRRYSTGP